jgi:hypothetical protein
MMRKKGILILITLLIIFGLYGFAGVEAKVTDAQIKSKIYDAFFKDLSELRLVIDTSKPIKSFIPADKIKVIEQNMKQITDIHEYLSDAAIAGVFKKGYHLMQAQTKQTIKENYRFQGLLYSKNNGAMIVRKYDVFPNTVDKLPSISVYEFKISKAVNDILVKYEAQIPKDIAPYICGSWKQYPGTRIREQ